MDFVNNWQTELTGTLPAGTGMALPVPPAALARLAGGVYLLTLADGETVEIIRYNGPDGKIEARGLEGTTARAWPEGSVIYAAVTAGQLTGLLQQISQLQTGMVTINATLTGLQQQIDACCSGGGGEGLTDQNGNTLTDHNGNTLEA